MKNYVAVIVLLVSIIPHIFVSLSSQDSFGQNSNSHDESLVPQHLILSKYLYAHQTIDNMVLGEKTGQILFVPIEGVTLTNQTKELLDQVKPGGIILFTSNIQTEEQTQTLTTDLQKWTEQNELPPFFIAVDEEGGVVERISFDPVKYTHPQLGKINDEQNTCQTTATTSQILNNLGINTNFAPVADIAFSDDSIMSARSFGNTPKLVSKHVAFTVDEYNRTGIISTAKHFPGHGRTSLDSHQILPKINITKAQWDQNERKPFESAIDSDIPFIMVGHLIYPQIDSEMTSTSHKWITEILCNELNYKGLIIADDVKMGAIKEDISTTTAKMLDAGNNMVIAVLDKDLLIKTASDIEKKYDDDEESNEILLEKILPILVLKYEISEINQTSDIYE